MAKLLRRWRWLGAAALTWGTAVPAWAAPTPAQILGFTPRQADIDCTTPAPDRQKDCKVTLIKRGKASGWMMSDADGKPLRRFFDSNADNRIDTWAYYKDGVEVYRETDTNFNGKPDNYRWLNAGGSKWGVDSNEDGRIDSWKSISPEEVSQEVLRAVTGGDYNRLQALLLTEAEIKGLGLSEAEAAKVRASLKQASAKFEAAATKLKGVKAAWMHVEMGTPRCRPADEDAPGHDLIQHQRSTILYQVGDKSDWLQMGEMVRVGDVWRLVEGPSHGLTSETATAPPSTPPAGSPKLQKLIEQLAELDKAPPSAGGPGPNPKVVEYNLSRASVLEKIIAEVPSKDRLTFIRQVADSLATAMQNAPEKDQTAATRLARLEKQITGAMKGSGLAAYVVYRRLQADYSIQLLKEKADYAKVQQDWMESLKTFVKDYPKADEAADALLQLGMTAEFLAKEPVAKTWYEQLARDFPDKAQATKARGALKRLDLEGKELTLAGSTVDGESFDISKLKGKAVAVYYWASWNQQSEGDFAKLKKLVADYSARGFAVVGVNLDTTAAEASSACKRLEAPGVQLHQDGGLECTLATDYGVMVLPNVFLVGKDGKVVSRTVQVGNLEEELKKLVK
jgi:hypothetical protein